MTGGSAPAVRIVVCVPGGKPDPWIRGLAALLPDATIDAWSDDGGPGSGRDGADYAVVWSPPDAFYRTRPGLKAIFNLGAGVDGLLRSAALPRDLPVIRLEDAGMAPLMAEYVLHAALRFAREFDRMDDDRRARRWAPRKPTEREDFPVGVLGAGQLGAPVGRALASHGFPVTLWSRSPKAIEGLRCVSGGEALDRFLAATRILVCLLPLTPQTEDFIDAALLARLMQGSHVINVARGRHLVDDDLLVAIAGGHVTSATLDVFREEPLPPEHPFWSEARITITPHCSALTQRKATIEQIAAKIVALESGGAVSGVVDRTRGY